MTSILIAIAPIFGLIALGTAAGFWRFLSPETGKGLTEFTFRFAVPALLFRTMVSADLSDTSITGLWATHFGAVAAGWICATLTTQLLLRRPANEAVVMSMTTAHGNLLLLGLPVALAAFGPAATPSVAILISLHSPVLWLLATMQMALAMRSTDTNLATATRDMALDLGRNPIVVSLAAGSAARMAGVELHPAIDRLLALLGGTSVPCALIALGMSLTRFRLRGELSAVSLLLMFKLILMPAVAWLLAVHVFALPPIQVAVVVLLAGMPTGANGFLFADRYGIAVGTTSAAVALGTTISFFTLTALIYALAPR